MRPNPPNFLSILEEVLTIEDEEYKKSHDFTYRHNPSSAMSASPQGKRVGACMRAMWYKAKQEPESNPRQFTSRLTAGFGNAIHTWFIDKLQKSKKLSVVGEAPGRVVVDGISKEISFRLDGLVTYRGEVGGVELKTGNGFGIQKMVKTGPHERDILQILSYFGTNDAIMWFGLVYLARESGFRAEYHIWREDGKFFIKGITPFSSEKEINELSFPGIIKEWNKLETHIESNEIPNRDYKVVFADDGRIVDSRIKRGYKYVSDKQCLWCSWQKKCWTSEGALEDSIKIGEEKVTTQTVKAK